MFETVLILYKLFPGTQSVTHVSYTVSMRDVPLCLLIKFQQFIFFMLDLNVIKHIPDSVTSESRELNSAASPNIFLSNGRYHAAEKK